MNRCLMNFSLILAPPRAPFGGHNRSKSCFETPNGLSKSNLWGTRRPTIHQDSLKVELGSSTGGFRPGFASMLIDFSFILAMFGAPFRAPKSRPGNNKTTLWIMEYRRFRDEIWIQKIPSKISKGSSKLYSCHNFRKATLWTTGLNNNLASN